VVSSEIGWNEETFPLRAKGGKVRTTFLDATITLLERVHGSSLLHRRRLYSVFPGAQQGNIAVSISIRTGFLEGRVD
jgi:hypothetical protein